MTAASNGGNVGSTPSRFPPANPDRADWMAAATCGAIAATPLVLAVVGWASSWNAYTNLTLTLSGVLFWIVLWRAWRDA